MLRCEQMREKKKQPNSCKGTRLFFKVHICPDSSCVWPENTSGTNVGQMRSGACYWQCTEWSTCIYSISTCLVFTNEKKTLKITLTEFECLRIRGRLWCRYRMVLVSTWLKMMVLEKNALLLSTLNQITTVFCHISSKMCKCFVSCNKQTNKKLNWN